MTEETQILSKAEPPESGPQKTSTVTVQTGNTESRFGNISIRGWLAIAVTLTVCVLAFLQFPVDEPLKSISLLTIGFYFGQKKQ